VRRWLWLRVIVVGWSWPKYTRCWTLLRYVLWSRSTFNLTRRVHARKTVSNLLTKCLKHLKVRGIQIHPAKIMILWMGRPGPSCTMKDSFIVSTFLHFDIAESFNSLKYQPPEGKKNLTRNGELRTSVVNEGEIYRACYVEQERSNMSNLCCSNLADRRILRIFNTTS
jgi:hypothetical protein